MEDLYSFRPKMLIWLAVLVPVLIVLLWAFVPRATVRAAGERIITIHYDGQERIVASDAKTVGEVLERANIPVYEHDAVEPGAKTDLVAANYNVNIYRARPVTVVDGNQRYRVMTPHTSAKQIAEAAGLEVYDEDTLELQRIDDFVAEKSVGLRLTIQRSTPVKLVLYGKHVEVRTQAKTIADLLNEKGIKLGKDDGVSPAVAEPITSGMNIAIYRNGVQVVHEEQEVAFEVEQVHDADRPIGYREVREPGIKGKKIVTYQIELRDGAEVGRKEIQSVVTKESKKQVEIIGSKPSGGLTKSKGVYYHVDSRGIGHRETYYDLPMNVVMGYCGGGTYSVRADGAKVDRDGYILVAANLSRYPRCSVVETSLGAGKVYDTGGFASVHPDGFDLATDWTNYDGR